MNNLQTKSRRLVRKTGSSTSENGEGNVRWVAVTVGKAKKLVSGLVLEGSGANGVQKNGERKRYYNLYGGAQRYVGERGGESNAG